MKSLQEYIIESIESDINEGRIWDAIKRWFNDLFSPSDKKFDRYKENGIDTPDYIDYIKHNFNNHNIKLHKIKKSLLNNIVNPTSVVPSKNNDEGFWQFIDEPTEPEGVFYALVYTDKSCKDTVCLIKINEHKQLYNNCAEILKVQILKEYQNYISFDDVVTYLEILLSKTHNGLFIKRNQNKKLYETFINDCDFIKTTYKTDINIAYKTFDE